MKLCVTIGFTVYIYRDPTYLMVMPPYSLADLSRPLFPYVHIDSNDAFQVRKASFYHFPIPFFLFESCYFKIHCVFYSAPALSFNHDKRGKINRTNYRSFYGDDVRRLLPSVRTAPGKALVENLPTFPLSSPFFFLYKERPCAPMARTDP